MHVLSLAFKACALSFTELAFAEAVESAVHGRADVSPFSPGWSEREVEGKHAIANRAETREAS